MEVVHKQNLCLMEYQEIELPVGYRILTIQPQGGLYKISIWYICDIEQEEVEKVGFKVYGTGHEVPFIKGEYISTIQIENTVWHFFKDTIK